MAVQRRGAERRSRKDREPQCPVKPRHDQLRTYTVHTRSPTCRDSLIAYAISGQWTQRWTWWAPTRRCDTSVELVADRGRIAQLIAAFGRAGELGIAALTGADGRQAIRDAARPQLIALATEGKLEVTVDKVFSLAEAAEAHRDCRPATRAKSRTGPYSLTNMILTTRCWPASLRCCARPKAPTTRTRPTRSWPPHNGWPPRRRSTWPWQGRMPTATKAQMPEQRTITIGEPGARGLRTYVQLFVVIAIANDVKCDVASNSTFVYAYGFAEDIDASHALFASLVMQMVRASELYIASGAHRPTPTITARINFQLLSAPVSASGWPRRAKRRRASHQGLTAPGPRSRCGTRTSS